jgi:GTP-binding protein
MGRGVVKFLGSFPGELPVVGLPEVAMAGRSNVGKSSAINALLHNKGAARVSSTPGRTQAVNLFQIGEDLVIADLPGYGFAKAPQAIVAGWKPMIEQYLGERAALRLVVSLVDSRRDAQDLDLGLLDALSEAEIPFVVAATKVDRLTKSERKPKLAKLAEGLGVPAVIPCSAKTGEGFDAVWAAIDAAAKRRAR